MLATAVSAAMTPALAAQPPNPKPVTYGQLKWLTMVRNQAQKCRYELTLPVTAQLVVQP